MARILPALALVLAACFATPPYPAPRIAAPRTSSLPAAYGPDTSNAHGGNRTPEAVPVTTPTVVPRMTSPRTPIFAELGDSTLDELVAEARRANTDVHLAEARLIGARSARRLATLELLPSVAAVGSTVRQQQSVALVPGLNRQLPQQQLWDIGFDASWEVDLFGRMARSVRARQALVASSEYDLDDVRVSITAEVARTYFELRGAQQQLAVSLRNAENQRRIVKLTEDRLAAGRGTAFDTERAHSILSLTLATIPGVESQIWAHRYRLATLLGRSPGGLPVGLLEARPLPQLPVTLNVRSADQLVRRRPDVLRAERQLAAQTLAVGAARTEYLPRLTLAARAGYVATSFDSLSRPGTSRLLAGPVISFPLLDLGRVHERVGVAEAFKKEAEAEYRATMLRALEENESALISYDRAHARLAILEEAVQSSKRAAILSQQRFEAGLTDFLQVLDAQRTQLDAENQLAQAHTVAATALVAVYKSVGGAWPIK